MANEIVKVKRLNISSFKSQQQRGVVLIMSLVILMVLALIGLSSMRTSTLQERMSGNARDYQIAFEAAELALRGGEDYLNSIVLTSDFSKKGENGLFEARNKNKSEAWEKDDNWKKSRTVSVDVANTSKNPEYMVEIVDSIYGEGDSLTPGDAGNSTIGLFRITSRGYGKNPNTRVMLQTDFGKFM